MQALSRLQPAPQIKGSVAEQRWFRLLCSHLGPEHGYNVSLTANMGGEADLRVQCAGGPSLLVEIKHYQAPVPSVQLDKFRRDLTTHHASGLFLSVSSAVSSISSVHIEQLPHGSLMVVLPNIGFNHLVVVQWIRFLETFSDDHPFEPEDLQFLLSQMEYHTTCVSRLSQQHAVALESMTKDHFHRMSQSLSLPAPSIDQDLDMLDDSEQANLCMDRDNELGHVFKLWLAHLCSVMIDSHVTVMHLRGKDAFAQFQEWTVENGLTAVIEQYELNSQSFGTKIMTLRCPGVTKGRRTKLGKMKSFHLEAIRAFLGQLDSPSISS